MTEDQVEHGARAYRNRVCRCAICRADHNEECKAYNKSARANARSMKLQLAALTDELAELRAFRDQFLSLAAQAPASPR